MPSRQSQPAAAIRADRAQVDEHTFALLHHVRRITGPLGRSCGHHLAERGARNALLMVGDRRRPSYDASRTVYQKLAERHGWTAGIEVVSEGDGEQGGYHRMLEVLDRPGPPIDAVAAVVDAFAVGVVRAVTELLVCGPLKDYLGLPRAQRVFTGGEALGEWAGEPVRPARIRRRRAAGGARLRGR